MQRISSAATFWHKWSVRVLIASSPVSWTVTEALAGRWLSVLRLAAIFAVFGWLGFVVWREAGYPLADEVLDGGDFLLVRFRRVQSRVELADVEGLTGGRLRSHKIRLRLAADATRPRFAFIPTLSLGESMFLRNPLADDLLARVVACHGDARQCRHRAPARSRRRRR